MKVSRLFTVMLLTLFAIDVTQPRLTFGDSKSILAAMHACTEDDDCVQAPEVYSACFHYCKGEKCNLSSVKDCPLFNRHFKNFPLCAANVPCRFAADGIRCVNGICHRAIRGAAPHKGEVFPVDK